MRTEGADRDQRSRLYADFRRSFPFFSPLRFSPALSASRICFAFSPPRRSSSTVLILMRAAPAHAVGLDDRGRIGTGLRADLVRVRRDKGVPVVRSVWREGRRVV